MSTNYYAEDEATCNNPAHTETLHIGKSSGGWKFGFHGIPDHEPPLTSWRAWREFLADRIITDEYGRTLTLDEFRDVVEKRYTPTGAAGPHCRVRPTALTIRNGYGGRWSEDHGDYHDADGFDFYDGEFS
jgi:hypothetical protein